MFENKHLIIILETELQRKSLKTYVYTHTHSLNKCSGAIRSSMVLPWPHAPVTLSIKPQQFCLTAQQHQLAQLKGIVLSSPFQTFLALPLLASAITQAGGDQLSNAMTISILAGLGTRQPTDAACQSGCKRQHVQQDWPFGCDNPKLDQASHECAPQYLSSYPSIVFLNLCVLPLLAFLQTTTSVRLQ